MRKFLRIVILGSCALLPVILRCSELVLWPWWVILPTTFITVWVVVDYADRCNPRRHDSWPRGNNAPGISSAVFVSIFLPLGLRVAGFVNWPWSWVLSPFFVLPALAFVGAGLLSIARRRDRKSAVHNDRPTKS